MRAYCKLHHRSPNTFVPLCVFAPVRTKSLSPSPSPLFFLSCCPLSTLLFRGAVGHGRMADFWALGILIHELSCGRTPYYSDDPLDGMRRILLNERKMLAQVARARPALASPRPAAPFRPNADAGRMSHSLMSSQDASRDLVEALLQIEPHRRLGYNGAAPLSAARTPPPRQGGGHPTPCWHTSPCFLVSQIPRCRTIRCMPPRHATCATARAACGSRAAALASLQQVAQHAWFKDLVRSSPPCLAPRTAIV